MRGDIADQAEAQEAVFREAALAAAAAATAPRFHPDFDGENCMDCGSPIEEGRLKLQKLNCVHCQSNKEKRQKHFGGR